MTKEFKLAPFGNLLVYDKQFTNEEIKKIIQTNNLNGLRIFDHLDRLQSLDFLNDLTFLKELYISCMYDQDFSFLKNLINLEFLGIDVCISKENEIDISFQTKLKSLYLYWRKGKILGLENCKEIDNLVLSTFNEKNLNPISCLKKITYLKITESKIQSLEGIEELTKIENLILGYCRSLKSIKHLNGLNELKSLEIANCNKIEDFYLLSNLPNLEELILTSCKDIPSIEFVQYLPNLKTLKLFGNTNIVDGNIAIAKHLKIYSAQKRHYNYQIIDDEMKEHKKQNMKRIKEMFNLKKEDK